MSFDAQDIGLAEQAHGASCGGRLCAHDLGESSARTWGCFWSRVLFGWVGGCGVHFMFLLFSSFYSALSFRVKWEASGSWQRAGAQQRRDSSRW